ncbi:caspase domain-containing protein [Schizophyllum commune]|nr:hypothetical protein K525DRAFT_266628 [Schizophyllum commune Loenen D]
MSDCESDASSEIERFSTSSASSSSSSFASVAEFRGLHRRQLSDSIRRARDAFVLPIQIARSISETVFQPSLCTGSKKAVCIGINYINAPAYGDPLMDYGELSGCIKDTRRVYDYLLDKEGFKEDEILLLTDEDTTPEGLKPTMENMLNAMRWLIEGAQKHDTLFFHCAGHGCQVNDVDGDEVDKKDEALVPWDYRDAGFITDDVIHSLLVEKLPVGCRLTALVDCCTSGTALDLPFVYRAHRFRKFHKKDHVEHRPQTSTYRLPLSECPDVVFWSGCKDSHNALDGKTMTKAFVKSMRKAKEPNGPFNSYERMLLSLRQRVDERIIEGKERQKPQFGTYYPVDMNTPFFITAPAK